MMGCFVAPTWIAGVGWLVDPTVGSFSFSLVNAHSRPVKLKLAYPSHAAHCSSGGPVQFSANSFVLMLDAKSFNAPDANWEAGTGKKPPYGHLMLDNEYERKCGLTAPTFNLGPGFMSGMPDAKFACAEIEVFAMKTSNHASAGGRGGNMVTAANSFPAATSKAASRSHTPSFSRSCVLSLLLFIFLVFLYLAFFR